jgi:NADH-quinone oxidoreductase subunit J
MTALFYIAAIIALVSTIRVVTGKHAVHALLYLIVSLLAVAVIFFMLGAPFAAALEVIIYAGAIMVLFIFVMMMLNLGARAAEQEKRWLLPGIFVGPSLLSLILAVCFVYLLAHGESHPSGFTEVGPQDVGSAMFSKYLLGVELVAMLLLAALVGAFHLARSHKDESSPPVAGTRAKQQPGVRPEEEVK